MSVTFRAETQRQIPTKIAELNCPSCKGSIINIVKAYDFGSVFTEGNYVCGHCSNLISIYFDGDKGIIATSDSPWFVGDSHNRAKKLYEENKQLIAENKKLKKQIAECPECSYDQTADLTDEDLENAKRCKERHERFKVTEMIRNERITDGDNK